jgi:homoserine dehydrogenase
MRKVKIALLGCGNVGKYLVKNIFELKDLIRLKYGIDLEIVKILVRDKKKPRTVDGFKIPQELFTLHFSDIIKADPEIIVELIGEVESARTLIRESLKYGKKIVTANKFILSLDDEIFSDPNVFFDASVGGGIPIIRTIQNAIPDEIDEVVGILNGTTNYILSSMESGLEFSEALEQAKKLGYAEPDPSFDINGTDAAQKICILTAICFGVRVKPDDILKEGITSVEKIDIEFAREFGYAVRGIAISRRKIYNGEEKLEVAVYPALVPYDSPISQVKGNLNAVVIKGRRLGELFLKGQGAGGNPTSISVLSDIIEASLYPKNSFRKSFQSPQGKVIQQHMMISKFYVRLRVVDRPGVLAKIADSFGRNNVSIESVLQKGRGYGKEGVPIFIITHECVEKNFKDALGECSRFDVVLDAPFYLRIYE